jgi:hypothetical protein
MRLNAAVEQLIAKHQQMIDGLASLPGVPILNPAAETLSHQGF